MRVRTAMMLTLAGTLALGCDTRDDTDTGVQTQPGEAPAPAPAPMPEETLVSVSEFQATDEARADAAAAPVRGTAELRRVRADGDLELHARVEGLTEGNHAWHIHDAPCGQQGQIALALSDAPNMPGIGNNLSAGGDGVADERVTIPADRARTLDVQNRQYSVRVHRGEGAAAGPAIACANIGGNTR